MATLALLPLPACQTTRPDPAAESSITLATAIGEPVAFLVEGGPLDEPAAVGTLTFIDATRRAVTTDPRLQAALARVRIAIADADQSRLLPNPVLNFVLRWGPGKPQLEVSLAQDIIQAFQIPRRSSAADNRLRQAAADALTVALDVTSEVQERYAASQASDRLTPVLEGRLELLRRLTGIARKRLEGGEGTRGDVTTLEAQGVELEVEIADARLRQREERLRLARLVGEPSGAATWALDEWVAPPSAAPDEQHWIDTALTHRPEVQSVVWQLAALGDDYSLARLWPWEGAAVGIDAQKDPDWFAGPSVSTPIPVFDMGQARRARVTAEQIEARHELTLSRRRIVEEVRVAHQSLAGNLANLNRVRQELIPLQQKRRDQAEQAYRAGHTDVTALFLAEQDLRATQAKAIDVERQTSIALIRLLRAVGGPGVAAQLASAPPHVPMADSTVKPQQR
ncbi:MAG: TolC family protein [Phycisphaerae bacterium]|nr:TolC family protein [Phycisphaerae bacterium]